MSRETSLHLNTSTVIGNTHHRGSAWHYRAEDQGDESNHYPGPIPVADVERRLFHWQAESRPLAVQAPVDPSDDDPPVRGRVPVRWTTDEGKQAICRSDRQDGVKRWRSERKPSR